MRSRGYGYLVGDMPDINIVGEKNYQTIQTYRQTIKQKDFQKAKIIREILRLEHLGVFAGDSPVIKKPPLKERILTPETCFKATQFLSSEILAFVDSEFTTTKHEILSIGCVIYHTKTKKTYTFYRTCKPVYEKKLSNRCKNITHLTQEEIDASQPFPLVLKEFQHFLKEHQAKYLVVWGNSDLPSFLTSIAYNKMSLKYKDWFNTYMLDIQPIISIIIDETRMQISLQDMKKYYHIEGIVNHQALDDAMDLKNIVLAFIKERKLP